MVTLVTGERCAQCYYGLLVLTHTLLEFPQRARVLSEADKGLTHHRCIVTPGMSHFYPVHLPHIYLIGSEFVCELYFRLVCHF